MEKSKSWDMRFNCLHNCTAQQQFHKKWEKGIHNTNDYFTKHDPQSHHCLRWHNCILKGFEYDISLFLENDKDKKNEYVRGCVDVRTE